MLLTCKKVAIFTVTRVYELFLQLFHVKALHSYLANPPQELFLLWRLNLGCVEHAKFAKTGN